MHPDLKYIVALLQETAAAEILPRFRRTPSSAKADGSLVTQADVGVQQRIRDAMASAFPGVPLLGEEMTDEEQERLLGAAGTAVWILDPLDGTGNFACGFPGFAISLALIEGGIPTFGIVLDPLRNECFHAAKGGGAFRNGEPIRPFVPGPELSDCTAMIDMKRLPPERVPRLLRPGGFRSQRNLGAVALEWCWLAAGRFQLYLHGGQRLWDYAAGRLIASEAGVPSRLYRPLGTGPAEGLDLESRLAIAAADATLLERWIEFVELPLTSASEGRGEGVKDLPGAKSLGEAP
jgi:myo-inositol-1(or 4)-monophosphatase